MGKLADHEGFDIGARRFFVLRIRADVSNVWVRQADNLPGVTRIGENFLVAGETCIENDFAPSAGDRARRATAKDAPVFERQRRGA